ncbi:MAG: hypothetical protein QNK85_04625 [Crocinitomicaceae bacterium]
MEKQRTKLITEEQLLETRERGLQEARQVKAMNAHGKVLGMDTFLWINPHVDMLATIIESLPFNLIWVGNHAQIKTCLETHPNTINNIQALIVQDDTLLNVYRDIIDVIQTITCIKGTLAALDFVKTIKKRVLIYNRRNKHKGTKEIFEQFISLFK